MPLTTQPSSQRAEEQTDQTENHRIISFPNTFKIIESNHKPDTDKSIAKPSFIPVCFLHFILDLIVCDPVQTALRWTG